MRQSLAGKSASSLTYFGAWTEKLFVSRRFLVHLPNHLADQQGPEILIVLTKLYVLSSWL